MGVFPSLFLGWGIALCMAGTAEKFPSLKIRRELVQKTIEEIERLDGEGLIPRANRPESWNQTTRRLAHEAEMAATPDAFGLVLRRLDATYPNLHAKISLAPEYDLAGREGRFRFGISFRPEVIAHGQARFRYLISRVARDAAIPDWARPKVGDEVTAINGKAITAWSRENFIFCKYPLREQCEDDFIDNLRREVLGWNRMQPLVFSVKRGKKKWDVTVPLAKRQNSPEPDLPCGVESNRYPGFNIAYRGLNACIFESEKNPGVSVWRITSFAYRGLSKDAPIPSLEREVEQIQAKYWKARHTQIQKVIFDVIENGGGDVPVPWYTLFLARPFQEQYFQLKKIKELEDPDLRRFLFYGDAGHELSFQKSVATGLYGKTAEGSFLRPQPQFCADEKRPCEEGLFQPKTDGFSGEVRLLVDEYCVSSCVGFVWEFKDKLRDHVKIIGFPDSGDSAYARVYLDATLEPTKSRGFELKVNGRKGGSSQELPENGLFRQQVSVTRSTDEKGNILSGKPVAIDVWVPRRYRHANDTWETEVFKAALEN